MGIFRKTSMVLAFGAIFMASVHASESNFSSVQAQPVVIFNQNDINSMFDGNDEGLQLAVLSNEEMRDTEGAYYWLYFYGPQITAASMWMYNSGWRTIPGWYHNIRQRW